MDDNGLQTPASKIDEALDTLPPVPPLPQVLVEEPKIEPPKGKFKTGVKKNGLKLAGGALALVLLVGGAIFGVSEVQKRQVVIQETTLAGVQCKTITKAKDCNDSCSVKGFKCKWLSKVGECKEGAQKCDTEPTPTARPNLGKCSAGPCTNNEGTKVYDHIITKKCIGDKWCEVWQIDCLCEGQHYPAGTHNICSSEADPRCVKEPSPTPSLKPSPSPSVKPSPSPSPSINKAVFRILKFNDKNGNGKRDADEASTARPWQFRYKVKPGGGSEPESAWIPIATDPKTGLTTKIEVAIGSVVTVEEITKDNWTITTPKVKTSTLTDGKNTKTYIFSFGNQWNKPDISCVDLTSAPAKDKISLGQKATFICEASFSSVKEPKAFFRYKTGAGDYVESEAVAINQNNRARYELTVNKVGDWTVQCRICTEATAKNCTQWGLARGKEVKCNDSSDCPGGYFCDTAKKTCSLERPD